MDADPPRVGALSDASPPAIVMLVRRDVTTALCVYGLSSLLVLAGLLFGCYLVESGDRRPPLETMLRFDGGHFYDIAKNGYSYNPEQASVVAFFPLFPLTGRAVAWVTGLSTLTALVVVSNLYLAGAFVIWPAYLRARFPAISTQSQQVALALFALWPCSFFFRFIYSESAFLFFALLAFYAMQRKWPTWAVALAVGAATACRPVGVALLVPFAMHVWSEHDSISRRMIRVAMWMPVAMWGLVAYMAAQYIWFGDPLAFAKTQDHWRMRPLVGWSEKTMSLLGWEPIWATYHTDSVAYWRRTRHLRSHCSAFSFSTRFTFC